MSNLGIIDSLALVLEDGMTALTGETGAGKTMVVGAIEMLLGARADSGAVRPGADEAVVEGRFDLGGDEVVISRVLPADGRSRAYVNGRMATLATLGEVTGPLVDLHGQNSHQSLLAPPVQRLALDVYGGIDTSRLNELRVDVSRLEREIAGLGGDAGARERELDLLRFQLGEIIGAGLDDPDEDDHLDTEETELASMDAHREAVSAAITLIADEAAAEDLLRRALASLAGRAPLAEADQRMREVLTELGDLVAELRSTVDTFHEDPERLAQLRSRRQLLVDLRRKYASAPRLDGTVGLGTSPMRSPTARTANAASMTWRPSNSVRPSSSGIWSIPAGACEKKKPRSARHGAASLPLWLWRWKAGWLPWPWPGPDSRSRFPTPIPVTISASYSPPIRGYPLAH
ncbi:MAG: hypothetical protein H6519_10375 [Microthrixaceae bacterium]|nr:hypothetical protein [Microthrixaceae bacterium]